MKIDVCTVVVGISKGKKWILKNFLKGIEKLSEHVDLHLKIYIGSVPSGTDFGIVEECEVAEIKEAMLDFNGSYEICNSESLAHTDHYGQVEDKNFPNVGEKHASILDKILRNFSENSEADFLLLMDYDSFILPTKIFEFKEIAKFMKSKKMIFGGVEEELKVREVYEDTFYDYVLHGNPGEKIAKGRRSIIYLPRLHNQFLFFTREALMHLIEKRELHISPMKTVGVFDEADYILYGDTGIFLYNSIGRNSGVTWILKSSDEMPTFHYRGLTLSLKNELETRAKLEKIYREIYENN